MILSKQQEQVARLAEDWFHNSSQQIFRIFGPAGSGKSHMMLELVKRLGVKALFAAYTGKASIVMQKKGCHGASTLHSLLYKFVQNPNTGEVKFILDRYGPLSKSKLLIVDEVSFVNEDMAKDILSFGCKVLVLGDPYQLPPVEGNGFFTEAKPDFLLTEIHRQALDNPIIKLAEIVRNGDELDYGVYGSSKIIKRSQLTQSMVMNADQVLVGLNKTRKDINQKIRSIKNIKSEIPIKGEKLICLKNDHNKGIMNGELFDCISSKEKKKSVYGQKLELIVKSQDFDNAAIKVNVFKDFFDGDPKNIDWRALKNTQQFDYGYAVSVHKGMGSEWDNIVLFDESWAFREMAGRHLYTAITRAAKKITIVI